MCGVTSKQSHVHAASLRRGSSFCQHTTSRISSRASSAPDLQSTECAAAFSADRRTRTPHRCAKREAVLPLARDQICALRRDDGDRCVVQCVQCSSRSLHAGADPLREGGIFCAKHTLPPAEHCASCGDTETALWPDMVTVAHYFKRFHCYAAASLLWGMYAGMRGTSGHN